MLHTRNTVLNAIYTICPRFKVMKEEGVHVNLTSAMKDCAYTSFMKTHSKEEKSLEYINCERIVGDALEELYKCGFMSYSDDVAESMT